MRLNINTTGHQIDAEEIVVPSSSPYVVRLKHHWVKEETPSGVEVWTDSERLESQLTEEAYDGNPSSGDKFQVDYKGEQDTEPVYKNAILFHSFQAGKTFYVWYKSQGDVYCAEDINAKADKDPDAVAGNLAEFDANGNPVDSGIDPDTKADKDSDAVEGNLAKFDSSGNPVDSGIASNTVPIATTANLTFYVNPSTGNDNNNGSSGSPFKTIAKAVSLIPQIVNHAVTINLADGSYSEGITLSGYVGNGIITINGNTTTPTNVVFSGQIALQGCHTRYITLSGLKTTYTASHAVYVASCFSVNLNKIVAIESASKAGVAYEFSIGTVEESTFSNRTYGILCTSKSIIYSYNNDGESNTYGLYCNQASTIGKLGTQPSGTTGEYVTQGGVIR